MSVCSAIVSVSGRISTHALGSKQRRISYLVWLTGFPHFAKGWLRYHILLTSKVLFLKLPYELSKSKQCTCKALRHPVHQHVKSHPAWIDSWLQRDWTNELAALLYEISAVVLPPYLAVKLQHIGTLSLCTFVYECLALPETSIQHEKDFAWSVILARISLYAPSRSI